MHITVHNIVANDNVSRHLESPLAIEIIVIHSLKCVLKIINFFYQLLYFTILRLHRPTIRIEFSMNFLYSISLRFPEAF